MGCLQLLNGVFMNGNWPCCEPWSSTPTARRGAAGRRWATRCRMHSLATAQGGGHSRWLNAACSSPFNRMVCSCFSFKKYIVFVYVCIYARAGVGNASDLNLIAIGLQSDAPQRRFPASYFGSMFTLHPLIHRSALGETPHKFQWVEKNSPSE